MRTPLDWIKKGISEFTDWYARHGFRELSQLHGEGTSNWSGESVTEAGALGHSVVWGCRRIIAESIAMLPLEMKRDTYRGKYPATDKTIYRKLKYSPNAEMTAMALRETMTGHSVMTGNAYAQIMRRSGTAEASEIWLLLPDQVRIDREKNRRKRLVYVIKDGNAAEKIYTVEDGKPQDILHVPGLSRDGICGYSVIGMATNSIGTALAGERHVGRFFARGGRLPYNLKLTQKWKSDQEADKFRNDWNKLYSDPHQAPILEPWLEYQQTGLNLKDSQMLESRQWAVSDICRWFQVSPHLVADLSHATFSNIENLAQQFVTFTLAGWLKRWEQNLWRCVLTPDEQSQGYYFDHNLNALLKGNFQARMAGYATALQNGYMNIDEVRDLEDMNPLPGKSGKAHHMQMNMATIPDTGKPTIAEQGILARATAQQQQPKGVQ